MGAKKKAAGKKKAAAAEDENDVSVEQFWKTYQKTVKELQVPVQKNIREAWDRYVEDEEKIEKFHIWDELGWAGTRAIMDSLRHHQ